MLYVDYIIVATVKIILISLIIKPKKYQPVIMLRMLRTDQYIGEGSVI